ncbi:MAG: ABC transporter substrate-binding protein [Chloroflexota bacterium]|nr:ABC transporter substrate-binding protein [Chloroflexota bacterium]
MGRSEEIERLLQTASPATRREFLKRAAVTGLSGPALFALLSATTAPSAAAGARQALTVPARAQGEPKKGGTMVVTGHQEVASLSPDDAGPTVHFVVVTQIHNALLEQDENFVFQPVLAEAMPEMSPDGLTYTFKLRQGVTFHDGEAFTSEDVKYTYEWYMNPANAAVNANNFASVASVETPDEYTAIVRLKEPNAAFHAQVSTTFIVPAHYHGKIGEDAYKSQPIGTGPFKLKEWRAAEYTLVEAYDGHFRGRPHLDAFRLNVVPEASVRAIALETGDSDSSVWPLVTEDNLRLADDPNFTNITTSSLALNHFPLNNNHPILSDKRVRQAMMHAIDRQVLVDDIFGAAATLATSNLSPALEAHYNPDVPTYPFDPARAGAILDEAGWTMGGDGIREKAGQKLSFVCTVVTGDQARRPEAEVSQQYLREVGIDMQIEEAPIATILEKMRSAEMDASLFNWTYGGSGGDPDASVELRSNGTNNFSHFNNPRVDELLDQGLRELDPAKRASFYKEVQAIVADEVPFLYMMFWDLFNFFTKRIKGLPESALTVDPIYAKAYQFWIDEG